MTGNNLVIPTLVGIHVFARAICVMRRAKKDVDSDLRQHYELIEDRNRPINRWARRRETRRFPPFAALRVRRRAPLP